MAKHFNQADDWENEWLTCPTYGWQSKFLDGKVETYVAFNWVKSLAWRAMFENRKNDFEVVQIEEQISFINEKHTDWAIRRKLHNTRKFVEFVLSPDFIRSYKN